MSIQKVALAKAHRLINHGPTVMLSAQHEGKTGVMSAAWVCALDLGQRPRLSAVIHRGSFTRSLFEQSGTFLVQVPSVAIADLVVEMGNTSGYNNPHKLDHVPLFALEGCDIPALEGCIAWLLCRLLPEAEMAQKYDLFIADIVHAWADDRVFSGGHWHFDQAPARKRSLHYIAGGHFFATGETFSVAGRSDDD